MARVIRYGGQIVVYAALAAILGYLSIRPAYQHFSPDDAVITLSFAHGAARKGGCRRLTPAEIAELPPNMRKPLDCPRERLPVVIELDLNGEPLFQDSLSPTGLAGDGPSRIHRDFKVIAGRYEITARLRDSARESGYDYVGSEIVELGPRRRLVVDFRADVGGFVFK